MPRVTGPKLIGIAAQAPASGKSTVAMHLVQQGYVCSPFARPLKYMAEVFLRHLGTLSEEDIIRVVYRERDSLIPGINVTARHLLQTLGTEWGRKQICPDVWLQCWTSTTKSLLGDGTGVVVDDVRFPNEADLVRSLGGQMWLINRECANAAAGASLDHASEGGLSGYPNFSLTLENNGSLEELVDSINAALSC
jgi:hypothetical protein